LAFYDYTYKSTIGGEETLIFNFRENTFKTRKHDGKEKLKGNIPEKLYFELSKEKTLLDTLGFKPCKRCLSLKA